MSSVTVFPKKEEKPMDASIGMFLFTVAIRLSGECSSVRGALDTLTHASQSQRVSDAILQNTLQNNPVSELRSVTVVKNASEANSPTNLMPLLNGLSKQDKNLAYSLDQELLQQGLEYEYLEKSWNISLKPEHLLHLKVILSYVLSPSRFDVDQWREAYAAALILEMYLDEQL